MNKIFLQEDYFTAYEKELVSFGKLSASLFTYSTGVKAVRLKNDRGAIVMLPYMGPMIWRAEFDGYDMTMKTIFDEPIAAKETFEETYGCFLMHCGLTAMGNPTAEDSHKPHGELPICKYQSVYVVFGEDEGGYFDVDEWGNPIWIPGTPTQPDGDDDTTGDDTPSPTGPTDGNGDEPTDVNDFIQQASALFN